MLKGVLRATLGDKLAALLALQEEERKILDSPPPDGSQRVGELSSEGVFHED